MKNEFIGMLLGSGFRQKLFFNFSILGKSPTTMFNRLTAGPMLFYCSQIRLLNKWKITFLSVPRIRTLAYFSPLCFLRRYMEYIIYRNQWSLVSLAHYMALPVFWFFHKHTTSYHSVDVDGFGACFEMGKKCYRMSALYIPSLCSYVLSKVPCILVNMPR